jgi:hypothetical protein
VLTSGARARCRGRRRPRGSLAQVSRRRGGCGRSRAGDGCMDLIGWRGAHGGAGALGRGSVEPAVAVPARSMVVIVLLLSSGCVAADWEQEWGGGQVEAGAASNEPVVSCECRPGLTAGRARRAPNTMHAGAAGAPPAACGRAADHRNGRQARPCPRVKGGPRETAGRRDCHAWTHVGAPEGQVCGSVASGWGGVGSGLPCQQGAWWGRRGET